MDVAIEECNELSQAIIKLRRARKGQYWGGRTPSVEDKAAEVVVQKRIENLVKEVADVQMMLDQIRFMVPGKYADAYEVALQKFAQELLSRGHLKDAKKEAQE
jgi:ABC-type phosphate transport system auxiliary subunit